MASQDTALVALRNSFDSVASCAIPFYLFLAFSFLSKQLSIRTESKFDNHACFSSRKLQQTFFTMHNRTRTMKIAPQINAHVYCSNKFGGGRVGAGVGGNSWLG